MRIPVLNGIYTDESSNFRTAYPRNLIPVPKQNGISEGYLKPADGIKQFIASVDATYAQTRSYIDKLTSTNGQLNKILNGYANSVAQTGITIAFDSDIYDYSYTGAISGSVIGAVPNTAYRVDMYSAGYHEVLQGSLSISSTGTWTIPSVSPGVKIAKLIRISDGAIINEVWIKSTRCRSYTPNITDPAYAYLKNACFVYDQSLALISACCINDQTLASSLAQGLVSTVAANSSLVCASVSAKTGLSDNIYVRTGTTAIVVYALSFFKLKFPTDFAISVVNIFINVIITQLMTYRIGAVGQQQYAFTGGYGKYSYDYVTFDGAYTITSCSTIDNILCYYALKLAGTVMANATYTANANLVANALVTNFWDATNNRFYQSVPVSGTDSTDSLDCHTLGSLFLQSYLGTSAKTIAAYSEIDLYKTIVGYKPYLTSRGYSSATIDTWGEGTLCAVLARLAHNEVPIAINDYSPIVTQLTDLGIPYSTNRDASYVLFNTYSVASISWLAIAAMPNGIFDVGTNLPLSTTTSPSSPGQDRGGINWNGQLYRVMGSKLCNIDEQGNINILGDVGGSKSQISIDYSFDRLAVCSEGNLYYWDGKTLQRVSDPDLRTVIDFLWIDGYFLTTDGTYIVVTELKNPLSVSTLKYGSSEVDPDDIKKVLKFRDELYAVNRYTTEAFQNVGGTLFPFQRIDGAMIPIGAIGTYTACLFGDYIAILGSGRKQPPSIYVAVNGQYTRIATREIDTILQTYSEARLKLAVLESRKDRGHNLLYIHLDDQTLVYDEEASVVTQSPVWFTLTSGLLTTGTYRARNLVWVYDKWICGDVTSDKLGYLTDSVSDHYGNENGWEINTQILYNEGNGAIFHELELVILSGRYDITKRPSVTTSYSKDGETWSKDIPRKISVSGNRNVRLNWLQQGSMRNFRIQKFKGTSACHISIAALLARIEPLAN